MCMVFICRLNNMGSVYPWGSVNCGLYKQEDLFHTHSTQSTVEQKNGRLFT